MTSPPPGSGRVEDGSYGQYGATDHYPQNGPYQPAPQYSQPGGYPQHGPVPGQPGPYAQANPYAQYDQYGQPTTVQPGYPQGQPGGYGQYGQPTQYAQPGAYDQYGQPTQYAQPGGYDQYGRAAGYPPYQPPPPTGSPARTGLIIAAVVVLVLAVGGGGWYFLLGPGKAGQSSTTPVASGPPSGVSVAPPAPPVDGDNDGIPGTADGADTGGSVEVDVEIGECIALGGTLTDAEAEPAPCGSPQSNHKVIGKAPTSDECPSDIDASYFESLAGSEVGALCLDIDWAEGDCFDLAGDNPARVSCTGPAGPDTVRVAETVQGTSDDSRCPDQYVPYPERNFIVCLDTVT